MSELYSNAEDCHLLSKKLKKELGNKIEFVGSTYTSILCGKYISSYRRNKGKMFLEDYNCLLFYIKFVENGFLRVSTGSYLCDNSLGERLAALSGFYKVLSKEYGEPTIFYTTKDDDEELLNLQWSFVNKEEDIKEFQNGTYFDDAQIDRLIVFVQKKEESEEYKFSEKTKQAISRQAGLPFELLYLVCEDMDNYIKHINGKEITIPNGSKIDGYPVSSCELKLNRKKNN